MSESAAAIVTDALTKITAAEQEQPVEAADMTIGIRYLNRMIAAWDACNIKLGHTVITSPNDILTIPAGVIEAVVANLAIRLAPEYDVPVSPELAQEAASGMQVVRMVGKKVGKMNFPGNLPVGSGNEGGGGLYDSQVFFPDCCEDENEC